MPATGQKNPRRVALVVSIVLCLVAAAFAARYVSDNRYGLTKRYYSQVWTWLHGIDRSDNVMIEMRDGVRLAVDVYLPTRFEPPYPTVYLQTLYGKGDYFGNLEALRLFAPHGYAIVAQDIRGRFASEGVFQVYAKVPEDGWDTLTWIAEQPWSDGQVGTFGCSALGESQYILANQGHPNHKAMIVESGGGAIGAVNDRHGYFGIWEGGVLNLASALGWFSSNGARDSFHDRRGTISAGLLAELPIVSLAEKSGSEPSWYEDYVRHQPGDPWWQQQGYIDAFGGFGVPGLHINQWFDLGVSDSLWMAFQDDTGDAAPQWAIVSPATHCASEELGERALVGELQVVNGHRDYQTDYVRFFDYWLKGEGTWRAPKVQLYVLGEQRWRSFDAWPPREARESRLYLDGHPANSALGNGRLAAAPGPASANTFVYDPMNPVATRGGAHCCTGNPDDKPGVFDQRASASRDDVLVFDSDVLQTDLTIAGPVSTTLHVQTSAADTDFTAKLVDVYPDGRAYNVQDGAFRLRYRNGFAYPELALADNVYEIDIPMRAVAYRFAAGHRIRLEVSSSNFPRLARNLNTGGAPQLEAEPVIARNTVHQGPRQPSRLEFHVLPND